MEDREGFSKLDIFPHFKYTAPVTPHPPDREPPPLLAGRRITLAEVPLAVEAAGGVLAWLEVSVELSRLCSSGEIWNMYRTSSETWSLS